MKNCESCEKCSGKDFDSTYFLCNKCYINFVKKFRIVLRDQFYGELPMNYRSMSQLDSYIEKELRDKKINKILKKKNYFIEKINVGSWIKRRISQIKSLHR